MPKEIPFQSPYDPSLKFALVNDINPQTAENEADYNLYRIDERGKRTRIAEYAWTGEYPFWSPDGRYLYVSLSTEGSAPFMLYRYELASDELSPFALNAGRLTSCDVTNEWCTFSKTLTHVRRETYQLSLLNKNTGEIRKVDDLSNQSWTWVHWLPDAPEFFYVPPRTDAISINLYNYAEDRRETLVELPQQRVGDIARSPDGRWLALFVSEGDFGPSDIGLVDLQSEDRSLISVIGENDTAGGVSQFSLEWSEAEGVLLFGMRRNGQAGIYTLQPGGRPRKLLDIPERAYVFDYALSPDGSQLAALVVDGTASFKRLWVVPIRGGRPREIPNPDELDEANCIGWFDEAVSMSGAAYLCDKYLGVG
ncbi:MAG: hypothetical protein K8I30_03795 [Anaerolineae bacterium]|nr:hypothetical protein [Anaerolineae bacterium]